MRRLAKLVRLLYSLAEEDLSKTLIKYQKGKTVSSDLSQLGQLLKIERLDASAEIAMGNHCVRKKVFLEM